MTTSARRWSGSSPRVRGAETQPIYDNTGYGIIPARAGSSVRLAPGLVAIGDHPRACGEQSA